MNEIIKVNLEDRTYPIIIGAGNISDLGVQLREISFPKQVAVISNPKVHKLYGEQVFESLTRNGYLVHEFNIPDGEEYKNLEILESIYDELIRHNFDRGCGIIALGGDVIGDMVGFAAATYLRGVRFVQVPTTLLSQVDSSVGGKTAVNHTLGKNLIGAFYQPDLVLIDVETLNSLDPREVSAGMAEVVKYGVIQDSVFFNWLEKSVESLLALDSQALVTAVKRSCQIKADIVEVDEKEGSIRAFLNFGHTFGHAVEMLSGYGNLKHGEAVAIGMVAAAKISLQEGCCEKEDLQRIESLLSRLNLPVVPPKFSLEDYVTAMLHDKKVREGQLTLVLNCGIGRVQLKKVKDVASVFSSIVN